MADVTAVLAVREGSAYLDDTLTHLEKSGVRPFLRIVTASKLTVSTTLDHEIIVGDFPTTGAAYAAGLEGVTTDWIWFLHDDSAPLPDTLDLLLKACDGKRAVLAAGPKQIGWDEPRELLEVGIVATRSARRVPELDPGEYDQGQFDHRDDVLGVGTAGMLVRTDALRDAGGVDPALGPFGDGFELSRRLRATGGRVIVVPSARIRHARQSYADTASSFGARRGAQMYNALQGAPTAVFPLLFLLYLVLAPLRGLARLVTKDGIRAAGELWGAGTLLSKLGQLLKGRQRLSKAMMSRAYTSLYATGSDVRAGKADIRKAQKEADLAAKRPEADKRRDLDGLRHRTRQAGILLGLLTLLLGIAGLAPHLTALGVSGDGLLPDSSSPRDLLQGATSSWVATGDGYPGYLEPLWVLAIPFVWLASLVGLNLTNVIFFLLVLAPFFAGLAAFRASREIANSAIVRFVAGLIWACAPPLLSAINAGVVSGVVVHIGLPLVLGALARYARTGASSSLGALAWWTLLVSAAFPPLAIVALVVSVVFALGTRRGAWLWMSVPALALTAPALWHLAKALPASLVVAPGVGRDWYLGQAWEVLAGWPQGVPATGIVFWIVIALSGVFVLAAVLSTVRRASGVLAGWILVSLGGLLVAGAMSLTSEAWPLGSSFVWLGLLTVVVAGAHGLRADLTRSSASANHVIVMVVAASVLVLPFITTGTWLASDDSLVDDGGQKVPALALRNAEESQRTRTLVLNPTDEGLDARVWRGNGDQMSEQVTSLTLMGDGRTANDDLARTLATIGSPAFAEGLAKHAIGIILVAEDDAASRNLGEQLDATDHVTRVSETSEGTFWRIDHTARLSQEGPLASGRITAEVEAQPGPLYLAERADPGWTATLDGQELPVHADDWRQAWDVPHAGMVHITHEGVFSQWWMTLMRAVVLLANLVVCLPIARRR